MRWLGLVVILVVVAGALGFLRYSPLISDVRGVRDSAQRFSDQARALEAAELDRDVVASLRAGLDDLDQQLEPIRSLVQDDPLVGVARALPAIGAQVAAADALVRAADSLVEAGELGLGVADRFVELRESNDADPEFGMMQGLVGLMVESSDDVDRIGELVDAASMQLAEIPPEALSQIREARDLVADPLDTYLPLLEQYREVDDVLPGLLGWDGERRYLVLAQNPAELRPAGGYAGTIGVIGFKDGALVEQSFQDVYVLDL
ncbi:MAG: DUF4012 domain-containing protein, partial [Chloroflexota bacterium]